MTSVLRPSKITVHLKNKTVLNYQDLPATMAGRKGFGRRLSPIAWTQEEVRKPPKPNRIKIKEEVRKPPKPNRIKTKAQVQSHHPRGVTPNQQNQDCEEAPNTPIHPAAP
jgi:hypothetical protein